MATTVPVKGLNKYRDRHGKLRIYHRATGKPIHAEFGTPEFFSELATLERAHKRKVAAPGTVGSVIGAYRDTPHFKDLADATKAGYLRYMNLLKPINDMALTEIDPPFLAEMRDRIANRRGRRTANYVLAMVSVLFTFANERGWVKGNPATDVKRVKREKGRPKANRPWSEEECQVVLGAAPPQLKVPIALAMFTGLRKADVIALPRHAVKGGVIVTSKTGEEVNLHIHPDLEAILDAAPAHSASTLAATSDGTSWTESGFNSSFYKLIAKLESAGSVAPGLTFHGLRHTVGTLLAEAGTDLDDIRRVLGQKTLAMAQHYSEGAKKTNATRGIVHRLDPLGKRKNADQVA
jgi:integrase